MIKVNYEKGKNIIKPVRGDIMDLMGILKDYNKTGKPLDIEKIIAEAKRIQAIKIAKSGM